MKKDLQRFAWKWATKVRDSMLCPMWLTDWIDDLRYDHFWVDEDHRYE